MRVSTFGARGAVPLSTVKICIASGIYHPAVGGPPTYLYALSAELARRGHRLRVVTHGQPGGSYPYPVTRIDLRQPPPIRLARFALATWRSGRSADLLFVNDYGLPPAVANLVLRKPVVMKIVGDFAWEYAVRHALIPRDLGIDEFQRYRYTPTVERLRAIQAWYARRADLIITPSSYLADTVAGWGISRDRIRVVYNAVPPCQDSASRYDGEQRQERTSAGVDVVTLARLAPWKGVDVLVDAVGKARRRVPGLHLLVVGDGEERSRLEQRAAAQNGAVHFAGELPRDAALAAMRNSQIVALCSAYEGLSHVLLEAMDAGLPIVASAVGGNLELIHHEENGLLVPYRDAEALAAALERLATDADLRARLGRRARAEADERAWPRMVDATLAVFDEAIARHRERRR